jgi:DNA-binding MarR family transcriptional regulator
MTETVSTPPREQVAQVADNVLELLRSFGRARARMLAAAAHDVEWSAHVLLKCLNAAGSMRAGELAETIHSDPSTVSRQVAALVKDGLLERRADPVDGRASLLVLTPKAAAVLAEHDRIRLDFFARVVDDWSADDLARFADLLARFTTDYENTDLNLMTSRMTASDPASGSAGRNE